MRKVFSYFENFVFRSFNFWDRATPLEYWCVMPVIWAAIIFTFVGDAKEFWEFLLRREVPPLNPLYYDSILLFGLTAVPRLSLTVRRFHDSGRRGKWANLPLISLVSGLVLMMGIGSTVLSSSFASGGLGTGGEVVTLMAIGAALVLGDTGNVWPAAFASAAVLNAIGWDAIWGMLSEVMARTESVEMGTAASQFGQSLKEQPLMGGQLLIAMIGTVATPFVAAFMHLFFMLLPSDRDYNSYGESSVTPVTGAPKRKTSENSLAAYACLFEKTPEEQARLKEAQKAELKALYRSRVLGQPDTPDFPV